MTTNSINYNKHLEDKRANLAREVETNRSNLANEAETKRHNLATEQLTDRNLQELIRHNQASESISYQQMRNALSIASLSAGATVQAAGINAAATRYASDNNFQSAMAGVQQRRDQAVTEAGTSRYVVNTQSNTQKYTNYWRNQWDAYNVTRQLNSREKIEAENREQRNRENLRNNITNFINGQSNSAANLVGSSLKFLPIGG